MMLPVPSVVEKGVSMSGIAAPVWQAYKVRKRFHSGEIQDYLLTDEVVEVAGIRVRVRGQEYMAPILAKTCTRKGLLVPLSDEPPVPPTHKSLVDRSIEAKAKTVEILPDGWAGMHWKRKAEFIGKCNDAGILQNIVRIETRNTKECAQARLEALQRGELASPEGAVPGEGA